mmetsp:Transcript_19245/g.65442  ORF Transcript_19245/g.65442 Transcript_19245/m.65442 type:complete len:306 (+) Transcript_19245:65-982(+)
MSCVAAPPGAELHTPGGSRKRPRPTNAGCGEDWSYAAAVEEEAHRLALAGNAGAVAARLFGGASPLNCKKARRAASPLRQRTNAGPALSPSTHALAIAHLRQQFPQMDGQVIAQTLSECGSIDQAIRRLTELSVSDCKGNVVPAPSPRESAPAEPAAPTADAGAAEPGSATPEEVEATPEQWAEAVVTQMQQASDVADAKARAGGVLAAFERGVRARVAAEEGPRARAMERDNAILKRAVAILHQRQGEEAAAKEAEVGRLQQMVREQQEQLQQAHVQNYSLSMHLRQAMEGSQLPGGARGPDVF